MGATVASPHPPYHFGEVVGRPLPKGEVTLGHRPRHFTTLSLGERVAQS